MEKKKKKSLAAMYAVPTRFEDLPEEDQAVFRAIDGRNYNALLDALRHGGDPEAYFYDKTIPVFSPSHSGKQPLHVAAKMGFWEGVELLVQLGVDVNSNDRNPHTGNTPLGLAIDSDRLMFARLLAIGADPEIPNHMGHNAKTNARRADYIARRPKPGMNYTLLVNVFERLPEREDFSGLTLDELFKRNEAGICLLDNPRVLQRFDEVAAALAESGTPVRLEHLQRTVPAEAHYLMPEQMPSLAEYVRIGVEPERVGKVVEPVDREVTYLERLAQVGKLGEGIRAVNAQGDQLQRDALLAKNRKPSAILELAIRTNQVRGLFTGENWKAGNADALNAVYQAVPEGKRWQVENFQVLSIALRNQAKPPASPGR